VPIGTRNSFFSPLQIKIIETASVIDSVGELRSFGIEDFLGKIRFIKAI
jgi:hypothetical protein